MLEDRAAILLAANSGTTLRVISLRGCTSITDSAVGEIVSWCPILEVLDLTRTKITDMGIWAINSKCAIREGEGVGVATTASLSGKKSLGAAAASIDKFSNSGSSFRGLKALYLDHTLVCADGSQALISFISRGGARLEDLSLLNCHILSDQHSVELIEALLRFAPNLVRLDARNTIVPALRPVEEALEKLVSSRNLKTLNVGGIGLETSEFIEKVSTMLPAEGVKLITPNW